MEVQSSKGPGMERKGNFWRRQFTGEPTREQNYFDFPVGILLPILCFMFDPIVFNGDSFGFGPPWLLTYKIFTYSASGLAILALALWFLFRRRPGSWSGSFAGILLTSAAISFVIGIAILPLTLAGMMFIVGFLGLTPFLVSFVYLRNGVRAWRRGGLFSSRALLIGSLVLSSAFLITAPAAAQWRIKSLIERSLSEAIDGDPQTAEAAMRRLRYFSSFIDAEPLMFIYESETNPARKARLSQVYEKITGYDIARRLSAYRD